LDTAKFVTEPSMETTRLSSREAYKVVSASLKRRKKLAEVAEYMKVVVKLRQANWHA
jgi:hypothetical protein